jgi:hypothetical protein
LSVADQYEFNVSNFVSKPLDEVVNAHLR